MLVIFCYVTCFQHTLILFWSTNLYFLGVDQRLHRGEILGNLLRYFILLLDFSAAFQDIVAGFFLYNHMDRKGCNINKLFWNIDVLKSAMPTYRNDLFLNAMLIVLCFIASNHSREKKTIFFSTLI